MPMPFAIALFLNQEREVLAVVVLVVHYVIKNHAAEHLLHILLALGKITGKCQKVEVIENGVGKGNVEQGSSCGYVNSIYQTSRLFVKSVENVRLNGSFNAMMEERLSALLTEISDCSVPFRRTSDAKTCSYCDFKSICGR